MTISMEARRIILVGALEEDAVFDLLAGLTADCGGDRETWFEALLAEAAAGTLNAYRHGEPGAAGNTTFIDVDLATLGRDGIGADYTDAVYLTRTDATLERVRVTPPPPPGHSLWITGLWGRPPS